MAHKTLEYILWSNCTNVCKFCLQQEKHDPSTILTPNEMIDSINTIIDHINTNLNTGDDVLIVGGEILTTYDNTVSKSLLMLFQHLTNLIKENKLRYLYLNTNLLYKDTSLLDEVLKLFVNNRIEEHLKFTSSYDIYGRYKTKEDHDLFLQNLMHVHNQFPTINTVVNTIMTKQAITAYLKNEYDPDEFTKQYHLKYVNMLPYMPSSVNREMDVTFKDIVKVLAKREKNNPGIINFYIDDFDLNQNKSLFEYHKNKGLIPVTAKYSECHHNSNFKKILPNGECFICKLINLFR